MFVTFLRIAGFAAAAAFVAACGSANTTPPPFNTGKAATFGLRQTVAFSTLPAGGKFTYDIGAVDPATHHYYLADRTNAALDVMDTTAFTVTYVHDGFAGQQASNDRSGPDGVVVVPGGSVYVGDVNSVKVISPAGSPVTSITTDTAGLRTDEGCYDA